MLKILKAELYKILHMPLFYIFLVLIILSSFALTLLYKPESSNIQTSEKIYTYNDFINSEKKESDNLLNEINEYLNLYKATERRKNELTTQRNDLHKLFDELDKIYDETAIKGQISNIKNELTTYKDIIFESTYLNDFKVLKDLIELNEYQESQLLKPIYDIIDKIEELQSDNSSSWMKTNVLKLYEDNYKNKLNEICEYAVNFVPQIVNSLTYNLKEDINNYKKNYNTSSSSTFNGDNSLKLYNTMLNKLDLYYKKMCSIIDDENIALISSEKYQNFKKIIIEFFDYCDNLPDNNTSRVYHRKVLEKIKTVNLINLINDFSSSILYLNNNSELVESINNVKNITNKNKEQIFLEIDKNKNNSNVSKHIENYILLCRTSSSLSKNLLIKHATNNIPQEICSTFYGSNYKNFSKYKLNESIVKENYYLNTNTYDNSYIEEPTLTFQNSEDNSLNFMYTSLRFSAVLLIIFMIIFSSILITKEQRNGSIKFMLSKPYSRFQIVSGKHLTLLVLSFIYMIVALIAAFVISSIGFGTPVLTNNILLVFNASAIIKCNIVMYFILYTVMLVFETFFYVLIASLFAFMFWSVLSSILSSTILIGSIFTINYFFRNEVWASYLPFYNANLFKYFGSGLNLNYNNIFQELLLSNINSNSNFFTSLIIISIYSIIIVGLSFVVHKKKSF